MFFALSSSSLQIKWRAPLQVENADLSVQRGIQLYLKIYKDPGGREYKPSGGELK